MFFPEVVVKKKFLHFSLLLMPHANKLAFISGEHLLLLLKDALLE
jgi:hypothetical protein